MRLGKKMQKKYIERVQWKIICRKTRRSFRQLTQHFRSYTPQCMKITEKVSFNVASEASYVYILTGQKLIKNAKNGPFWRILENLKLPVKQCYQTGQFLLDKNWWKMPRITNSNSTYEQVWHFPQIFVMLKMTCLVTLFDQKLQFF